MSKEIEWQEFDGSNTILISDWSHDNTSPCCQMPKEFCNCDNYELSKAEQEEMEQGEAQSEVDMCMDCWWGGVVCDCPPKSWQMEDEGEVIANAIGFPLWVVPPKNIACCNSSEMPKVLVH